ncbi:MULTISPECIES: DUF6502 family protein [unclassified Variovorax]|uniref:DUF6502 family protein n=1 Tax=unclassified Variovorax TaxID=663243 RepID=UPI00210F1C0D|nr:MULTISPECIES: DUF6502 family protein [unclassified Variovorax]
MASRTAGSQNVERGRSLHRALRESLVQTREGQLAWVLGACERVLRPLVRLALAFGVKHTHLDELLRDILVDEARRAWLEKGTEPNISQISVTTGLNRKVVTTKVRDSASLPRTESSAEAKALTLWLQMVADNPKNRSLPILAQGRKPSFEALARRASRGNVHHRVILDELVRLKMATELEGRTELAAAGFVPSGDLRGMLAFLGDNARDHLLASVSNTLGAAPPLLERSVFASGLSLDDCERIHRFARERWDGLHHALTQEMRQAYEAADEKASGRIRVGIYTYYEDAAVERDAAAEAAPSNPPGRKTT